MPSAKITIYPNFLLRLSPRFSPHPSIALQVTPLNLLSPTSFTKAPLRDNKRPSTFTLEILVPSVCASIKLLLRARSPTYRRSSNPIQDPKALKGYQAPLTPQQGPHFPQLPQHHVIYLQDPYTRSLWLKCRLCKILLRHWKKTLYRRILKPKETANHQTVALDPTRVETETVLYLFLLLRPMPPLRRLRVGPYPCCSLGHRMVSDTIRAGPLHVKMYSRVST